jgi:hypothetical protein
MRQKLNLITLGVQNLRQYLEFCERGFDWKNHNL